MCECRVLGLVGCLLVTTSGFAADRSVSDKHITLDQWQLVPTLVGTQVESFLGLRDEILAVGNNITAVWFLRLSDRHWQAFAWHNQDNLKSIAHVKSTLELDDSTDIHWPDLTAQDGVDPSLAVEPDAFGTGVFQSDPISEVIDALADPGSFIEMLTDAGWTAANITIQTDNTICTQDELLSTLAAIVEADDATGAGGSLVASFTIAEMRCDEWLSISAPLDSTGRWSVKDLTPFLESVVSIDPTVAWQSIAAGAEFLGAQTLVIDAGGNDETGQPLATTHFVITLKDVTPPSVDFTIVGDRASFPSPSGVHSYYVSPVTVNVNTTVTDGVDPAPTVTVLHNGEPFVGGSTITEIGIHTIIVQAVDSAGNEYSTSNIFEIRKRRNFEANLYVEDITTVEGMYGIEQVSVTVRLTAEEFDIRTINTNTLNLWLAQADGNWIRATGDAPILIDYENFAYKLIFVADFSNNPLAILPPDIVITGRGDTGTTDEYDYYTTAEAVNDTDPFIPSDIDEGEDPLDSGAASCQWTVQFCTSRPQVCLWDITSIPGGPVTSASFMAMWIFCTSTTAFGFCWIDHIGSAGVSSVCSKVNGGYIHIFQDGDDCCEDCTITVRAVPTVAGRCWIDPTGTATVYNFVSVEADGIFTTAFGSASIYNTDGGSYVINGEEFEIPAGQLQANYVATTDLPIDQQFALCELTIQVVTAGTIFTSANSSWLNWFGAASSTIEYGVTNLTIATQANCPGGDGIHVIIR